MGARHREEGAGGGGKVGRSAGPGTRGTGDQRAENQGRPPACAGTSEGLAVVSSFSISRFPAPMSTLPSPLFTPLRRFATMAFVDVGSIQPWRQKPMISKLDSLACGTLKLFS